MGKIKLRIILEVLGNVSDKYPEVTQYTEEKGEKGENISWRGILFCCFTFFEVPGR